MDYDREYARHEWYFGQDPDDLLVRHCHLLDGALPVLDLGAGQGRHSLFLARQGFTVHAVDPSQVAMDRVADLARQEELSLQTTCGGFEELQLDEASFGGVLLFGLVQLLRRQEITTLCRRVTRWTVPAGLVWISAHTSDDPGYARIAAESEELARHSFRRPDGEIRTYLEPGELLSLFDRFEVVHHWEGLGPEHRHGDGPLERHARAEAVLRRR